MLLFIHFLKKKKEMTSKQNKKKVVPQKSKKMNEQVATRKGELGEYKINIQLDQLPKDYRHLSDLLVKNPKTASGFSQIDHVVITPYGIFVIETKNYQGTIYDGSKDHKSWFVNGKQFTMLNPFVQNKTHISALTSFIDKQYHDLFISMVSFTKRCTFKVDPDYRKIASNELIVYDIELSEFIHRKVSILEMQHKEPLLTATDILVIYQAFSKINITDPESRAAHVSALKSKLSEEAALSSATCTICHKPVSEKVKAYCLSNKKFSGKIYCYEHQKDIK